MRKSTSKKRQKEVVMPEKQKSRDMALAVKRSFSPDLEPDRENPRCIEIFDSIKERVQNIDKANILIKFFLTGVEKRLQENKETKEISYLGHAFHVSLRMKDDKGQSQEFCDQIKACLVDDGYEVLRLDEAAPMFSQPVPDGAVIFSRSSGGKVERAIARQATSQYCWPKSFKGY